MFLGLQSKVSDAAVFRDVSVARQRRVDSEAHEERRTVHGEHRGQHLRRNGKTVGEERGRKKGRGRRRWGRGRRLGPRCFDSSGQRGRSVEVVVVMMMISHLIEHHLHRRETETGNQSTAVLTVHQYITRAYRHTAKSVESKKACTYLSTLSRKQSNDTVIIAFQL